MASSERVGGGDFRFAWEKVIDRAVAEVFFDAYVSGQADRLGFFEGWLAARGFGGLIRGRDAVEVLDDLWAWRLRRPFPEFSSRKRGDIRDGSTGDWFPILGYEIDLSPYPTWFWKEWQPEMLEFASGMAAVFNQAAIDEWGCQWRLIAKGDPSVYPGRPGVVSPWGVVVDPEASMIHWMHARHLEAVGISAVDPQELLWHRLKRKLVTVPEPEVPRERWDIAVSEADPGDDPDDFGPDWFGITIAYPFWTDKTDIVPRFIVALQADPRLRSVEWPEDEYLDLRVVDPSMTEAQVEAFVLPIWNNLKATYDVNWDEL